MAYSTGMGSAGGGAIGTEYSCVIRDGCPGPGQVQSWTIVEEITLTPVGGGAVSSVSGGTVADADGAAVDGAGAGAVDVAGAGAVDVAAGGLVPPDCGAGGVHAVSASSSASIPTPVFRALLWIFPE